MSTLRRSLVLLILQFLDEEKYSDSLHTLEKESGVFFDIKYFEDAVTNGEWEDAEKYLSGFTKPDDNTYSRKIFFEIRKCKFLDAFYKGENSGAVENLMNDLKVFSTCREDICEEITLLLTLKNSGSARTKMFDAIKNCIVENPIFHNKLHFPTMKKSKLITLIVQAFKWQYYCRNIPIPKVMQIFLVNHSCHQPNGARASSTFKKDLVLLILQFLDEENYKDTLLEKESGIFFDISYFEDALTNGEWDAAERYLSCFTKPYDNLYSRIVFFEMKKYEFLEAHKKGKNSKAVENLWHILLVLSSAYSEDLPEEFTMPFSLENSGGNATLSEYGDGKSAWSKIFPRIKKYIVENPKFHYKLQFPTLNKSQLRTLIMTASKWHHHHCKNLNPKPNIDTLLVNHTCDQPSGLIPPSNTAPLIKRPRTLTNNPALDHQTVDSEQVLKRSRPFRIPEEVKNLPINTLPVPYPGQSHAQSLFASEEIPKTVMSNMNIGSGVKSMDFHPLEQTLLLVGTDTGEISLWAVSDGVKLASRKFKVWDLGSCTKTLQASLANECSTSVNRVIWSPDGNIFGVAYSNQIVQLYSYHGVDDLRNQLEIEAHIGSVNDLAFGHLDEKLCVITCGGEDKSMKVWDAASGAELIAFVGRETPFYSIRPHLKENNQFIYSTDVDRKIKAGLYDNVGYDAPGHSFTTMAYSADRKRLFVCGRSNDGESYIVEWDEIEGAVKRTYLGLGKGVVQFDTTKNRFLAVGDEFKIKFWDMDDENLLISIEADGGLPASPCIRFNKAGSLMAVSTSENGVKILANSQGFLQSRESHLGAASKVKKY